MCEQGCPALIQTRNITVATRPLGSRRTRAQRHVSLNTVALRVQRGLCAHWPVGKRAGERHDSSANQSTRGGAKQHQQHPGAQSLQSPPAMYCSVLYCTGGKAGTADCQIAPVISFIGRLEAEGDILTCMLLVNRLCR